MLTFEEEIMDWLNSSVTVKDSSCQLSDIDEAAAREGEAIQNSLRMERPARRKSKVPGWQRFKVQYHK